MAELRDPNLKRALSKNTGADAKAVRNYRLTRDRVNAILLRAGVYLPADRRAQIIANIRAGYINFDYLRDQTSRYLKQQTARLLDNNRGTPYDNDLRAIRDGFQGIQRRIRYMYRSRGLPIPEDEVARQTRAVIAGYRKLEDVRGYVSKIKTELDPAGNVGDIGDDASELPESQFDMTATAKALFPFLSDELIKAFVDGWSETGDPELGMARMRESPAYEREFPGNKLAPGQFAMSESDYLAYKAQARDLMAEYGLPAEYFDRDEDIGRLVSHQVRLSQLEERIRKGYVAALQAPESVRQELSRSFGMGIGDLAAFWLDPTKGEDLLQRKYTEAQIRGAASDTGFGQLGMEDSELLAQYGVDYGQAQEGFGGLVEGRGLFEGLVTSQEQDIELQDQLGATFLGDAEARERIRRRAESRIAAFGGGGGAAQTQEGTVGLRTAGD